jgi:hypothetical protein
MKGTLLDGFPKASSGVVATSSGAQPMGSVEDIS